MMALYLARALVLGLIVEWLLVWVMDKPLAGFLAGVLCIFVLLCLQFEVADDAAHLVRME